MTSLLKILPPVLVFSFWGAVPTNSAAPQSNEWISGHGFRAIQAAVPELQKRGFQIDDYYVAVRYEESATWVVFSEGDMVPATEAGSLSGKGIEVMLNKEDLTVIGSHFSR